MRVCPSCGREFPEVVGAPDQQCPFCGHVVETPPEAAPGAGTEAGVAADPAGALAHAARYAARHYPRLLLLWLPLVLVDAVLFASLKAYSVGAGLDAPGPRALEQDLALLGVGVPLYFAHVVLTFAGWTLVAAHLLDHASGGPRRGLVGRAWRRLPAALALGLVLAFTFLAGAPLLVPFLVLLHGFMFAPSALAEGQTVRGALDASRRFAREWSTPGFTALVVFVGAGAMLLAYGGGSMLEAALQGAGVPPVAAAASPALLLWLVAPLLPLLPASLWHLAAEAGAAGAPSTAAAKAAAPARAAQRRAKTTKCPTCGTLIPYEPTGSPVQVRCPACGTSGRVL